MTERLLHFIWQFQYFNKSRLETTDNRSVQVLQPGSYNTNQGPDFLNAKLKMDETIWAGSIELHTNTSEWQQHQHSRDKNYNNVILHVVWNNDIDLDLPFPTLELKSRVSKLLLKKYDEIMRGTHFIPCQDHIRTVDEITITGWKVRLMIERLQNKSLYIKSLLQQNNQHWEEVLWWTLARNFGTKVNSDAFEKMAQSIPLKILAKHKNQSHQFEALLMGQAGLLEKNFTDEYPAMLQKEYLFLQKKYRLNKIQVPVYMMRMRPANFPEVRLSQLAALIQKSQHLFATIKEAESITDIEKLFAVPANDYWDVHYVFDETVSFKKKIIGRQMIQSIMINTIVPLLYAFGYYNNNDYYKNKALKWMSQLKKESNHITKGFESIGINNNTVVDSQALIQLKKEYCDQKRCLQCAIGNKILAL